MVVMIPVSGEKGKLSKSEVVVLLGAWSLEFRGVDHRRLLVGPGMHKLELSLHVVDKCFNRRRLRPLLGRKMTMA